MNCDAPRAMNVAVHFDRVAAGAAAAAFAAERSRAAIAARGEARIVVTTGTAQFDLLNALVEETDVAWERVTAFQLAEYIGLPIAHPSSFRAGLWERFQRRLRRPLRAFHSLDGLGAVAAECRRAGALLEQQPLDLCFTGIGEEAQLGLNGAPADFEARRACLPLTLDAACRRQQYSEGWFPTPEAVPTRAIALSPRRMLAARTIVVTAPDARRAAAVKRAIEGEVTPLVPASILQRHPDAHVFLDEAAAALLRGQSAAVHRPRGARAADVVATAR
jgi:glucosamine-6-phosphate deaminase